jgi:hypothetical protein
MCAKDHLQYSNFVDCNECMHSVQFKVISVSLENVVVRSRNVCCYFRKQ